MSSLRTKFWRICGEGKRVRHCYTLLIDLCESKAPAKRDSCDNLLNKERHNETAHVADKRTKIFLLFVVTVVNSCCLFE